MMYSLHTFFRQQLRTLTTFFFCLLCVIALSIWIPAKVAAQGAVENQVEPVVQNTYHRAKITEVETSTVSDNTRPDATTLQDFYTQTLTFQLFGTDETHEVQYGSEFQPLSASQLFKTGQRVIVQSSSVEGTDEITYQVIDAYRLIPWILLVSFFLCLVFLVARWRGLLSVFGMTATIGALAFFLIPAFLQGYDPLLISILGSIALAALTLYITHGWRTSTHIAFISVVGVLSLVGLLAYGSVLSLHLSGMGSEEALFLRFLSGREVQLQGLLLGGILLGTLGVLDDIIVSQIAVVKELFASKPDIGFPELFQRSLRVGQTHVASLVNTLVLVYAGANLPLFLLFSQSSEPLWVTLNSELIMEEMVRTLTGSIGLVLAVPISTLLAALSLLYLPHILAGEANEPHGHTHHHTS